MAAAPEISLRFEGAVLERARVVGVDDFPISRPDLIGAGCLNTGFRVIFCLEAVFPGDRDVKASIVNDLTLTHDGRGGDKQVKMLSEC